MFYEKLDGSLHIYSNKETLKYNINDLNLKNNSWKISGVYNFRCETEFKDGCVYFNARSSTTKPIFAKKRSSSIGKRRRAKWAARARARSTVSCSRSPHPDTRKAAKSVWESSMNRFKTSKFKNTTPKIAKKDVSRSCAPRVVFRARLSQRLLCWSGVSGERLPAEGCSTSCIRKAAKYWENYVKMCSSALISIGISVCKWYFGTQSASPGLCRAADLDAVPHLSITL